MLLKIISSALRSACSVCTCAPCAVPAQPYICTWSAANWRAATDESVIRPMRVDTAGTSRRQSGQRRQRRRGGSRSARRWTRCGLDRMIIGRTGMNTASVVCAAACLANHGCCRSTLMLILHRLRANVSGIESTTNQHLSASTCTGITRSCMLGHTRIHAATVGLRRTRTRTRRRRTMNRSTTTTSRHPRHGHAEETAEPHQPQPVSTVSTAN